MPITLISAFRTHAQSDSPIPPSENAEWLLQQRYYLPILKDGQITQEQSFTEFARRVARIVTSAEIERIPLEFKSSPDKWLQTVEQNIYNDIVSKSFLFNSPALFGAGVGLTTNPLFAEIFARPVSKMSLGHYSTLYREKTENQQLFACFVIDVEDDIEDIFDSVKDAALISKFGGGVGCNFGNLRERGEEIKGGTGGHASGPVSFMELWNTMGSVVVQGGKRRAALMGILPDNHPDIFEFMNAKTQDGKLPYFNISVGVSDKLMEAVEKGQGFSLISRGNGEQRVKHTLEARELWNTLCGNAWKGGDPGVFFVDTSNQDSLLKLGKEWLIESSNPCGEENLPPYTSCNLGSINLRSFIKPHEMGFYFDFEGFLQQVMRAMYYLDLVIDASSYPLKKIEERTKAIRPVGLGIMGLADAAIMLGMQYGSAEFQSFCEKIATILGGTSLIASVQIVEEMDKPAFPEAGLLRDLFLKFNVEDYEGPAAPLFEEPVTYDELSNYIERMHTSSTIPYTLANTLRRILESPFFGEIEHRTVTCGKILNSLSKGRLRNSRRLSIAPTGSISMLLDTSAGIEPNFAWHWSRRIAATSGEGHTVKEYWHNLLSPAQQSQIRETGKLTDSCFVTAHDVPPETHVEITGIFAQIVDSGISKTVNLPNEATVEDVKEVYQMAYKKRMKGITIYRDGSRSFQPIEAKKKEEKKTAQAEVAPTIVKERPGPVIFGKTMKETTPWGSLYVTLNLDGASPFEVFATVGKSGSELKAMTEALSRVISIGLRSGGKVEDFIRTLKGLSGKESWMLENDEEAIIRSIPDAIATVMEKLTSTPSGDTPQNPSNSPQDGLSCPECNTPMEILSGCAYCFSCGYSPCK